MLQHSKLKYNTEKNKARRRDYTNCKYCGGQPRLRSKKYADGTHGHCDTCSACAAAHHTKKHSYRKHKKDHCELCGFIPEHRGQLQVDHIDGSKKNNDESNLQTLCGNCHKLKTVKNVEFLKDNFLEEFLDPNRPKCQECCINPSRKRKHPTTGERKYDRLCTRCRGLRSSRFGYKKYKKDVCEKCGFIPEDQCQLDVDHINGDHNNSDPSNLQTLCHNCHMLKTYTEKDNLRSKNND